MNCDTVEYCMAQAREIGGLYAKMARETLTAQLQLIDPVWGGVYQYSTDDDWKHPHFEKIMQMQAGDMRGLRAGLRHWHEPRYFAGGARHRSLPGKIPDQSGLARFSTSQDADLGVESTLPIISGSGDAKRRRQGIPRVDKHIYSRENGWAIERWWRCIV